MIIMFSNNGKPISMIGVYTGANTNSGLKSGHEYRFDMYVDRESGYWVVEFAEPQLRAMFSCIDAIYQCFIKLRMIMPDGHVAAF